MMKLILTDITTLPELKQFLEELPKDQHDYIDWSSLPTFGGEEPDDTTEVWSWDEENLLVGTCCSDWEIISRTAWTIAIDRVKYPGTMQDRSLLFVGSTNALGEELFNEIKSNSFIEISDE